MSSSQCLVASASHRIPRKIFARTKALHSSALIEVPAGANFNLNFNLSPSTRVLRAVPIGSFLLWFTKMIGFLSSNSGMFVQPLFSYRRSPTIRSTAMVLPSRRSIVAVPAPRNEIPPPPKGGPSGRGQGQDTTCPLSCLSPKVPSWDIGQRGQCPECPQCPQCPQKFHPHIDACSLGSQRWSTP